MEFMGGEGGGGGVDSGPAYDDSVGRRGIAVWSAARGTQKLSKTSWGIANW